MKGFINHHFEEKTNSGQTRKNILILKEDFENKIKILEPKCNIELPIETLFKTESTQYLLFDFL